MGVETWDKPLTEIDGTYGYNDYLIFLNDQNTVWSNDSVAEKDATGVLNPSKSLSGSEDAVQKMLQTNDRLFRLPNGALLLRRSVFTDTCLAGRPRPDNILVLSEPMTRALAFFGASYQGSDPSGELWCRRVVPGTAEKNIETPWDVSSKTGLERMQAALGRIRSARAGNLPSELQPAQHALAKELAGSLSNDELNAVSKDIGKRLEAFAGLGDLYLKHPILHTLGIAVLFGLGTDAYHLTRYLIAGGKSPFEGPFSVFGGIRNLVRGIIKFFGGGPKDPPQGGSGGGSKELPRITPAEMPAGSQVSGGFVVQNGETIGVAVLKKEITSESVPEGQVVAGEINTHGDDLTVITAVPDFGFNWDEEPTRVWEALPDGVVPLDEGALIYRYQATINGEIVGLSENVARNLAAARGLAFDPNSFFSAGEFTSVELRRYAGGTAPAAFSASPDDAIRSLKLKGVKPLETGSAIRLSSRDEAAAVAADRMTSGDGGRVTGFGASGAGVRVPAPMVRVIPIPVVP